MNDPARPAISAAPVLFVVPTFNRAADLPRTIEAIAAQAWPADRLQILIVDNASTDDTANVVAGLVARLPCRIEHIRKAREGPTVARNLGLRLALERFGPHGLVALVDSDVQLDAGWLAATSAALAADPGLAQVGGKLVFAHAPDVLNSFGGALGRLGLAWDAEEGEAATPITMARNVLWINTSAVLMRPAVIQEVGGFDEQFFTGYEEPDLGLRLAMAGWRSQVVPDAVALHHTGTAIGQSHPEIVFHYNKNRLRMGLKSLGAARLFWFVPVSIAYTLVDASLHRPRAPRLRSIMWNLRMLGETWHLRRITQRARRVPDREALALLAPRLFPPERLGGNRRRPMRGSIAVRQPDDRVEVA